MTETHSETPKVKMVNDTEAIEMSVKNPVLGDNQRSDGGSDDQRMVLQRSVSFRVDPNCGELMETESKKVTDHWLMKNSVSLSSDSIGSKLWYANSARLTNAEFLEKTGCEVLVLKTTAIGGEDDPGSAVHFLAEWKELWNTLIDNDSDWVAKESPLLFTSVRFFYDPWIISCTLFLNAYCCVIKLISFCSWPGGVLTFTYGIAGMCFCIVAGAVVVKGSFFGTLKSEKESRERSKTLQNDRRSVRLGSKKEAKVVDDEVPSLADLSLLRVFFQSLGKNAHKLYNHSARTKKVIRKTGEAKVSGFYATIEAATEYLCTLGNEEHKFKPRPYTEYFLLLFLIVSPIVFFADWISSLVSLSGHCSQYRAFSERSNECDSFHFEALFFLGFTVNSVAFMMMFLTAGVLLAVLLYGSDVANALTIYWMLRFQPLRCTEVIEKEIKKSSPAEGEKEETSEAATVKEVTPPPAASPAVDGGGDDAFQQLEAEMQAKQPQIERDAYERYLLVFNYMRDASLIWAALLTAILLVCLAISINSYYSTLYIYATKGYVRLSIVWIGVFTVLVMLFVVYCISYANSAVDRILNGFVYSAKNDYSFLGGRDTWIAYVNEAPIYWYIFGFAITRTWLLSFIGGGVSAIVGGIIMSYAVEG